MASIHSVVCLIVVLSVTDTFSKPQIQPRIYGGHLAEMHQFPFITSIQVKNCWDILVHVCGGSIVSSKLVLTAAHCTKSKGLHAELYRVFFGANEKSEGKEFAVKRFFVHPSYNSLLLKNDLMFIELTESIKFSSIVQPIPLNREMIGDGVRVLTAGWGRSNDGITSLKSIELETMSNHVCYAKMLSVTLRPPVHDNSICAYSGKFGNGICVGDSGNPLVYNNTLIGVSTWASPDCADGHPDGFHRISSFTHWIDEVLKAAKN